MINEIKISRIYEIYENVKFLIVFFFLFFFFFKFPLRFPFRSMCAPFSAEQCRFWAAENAQSCFPLFPSSFSLIFILMSFILYQLSLHKSKPSNKNWQSKNEQNKSSSVGRIFAPRVRFQFHFPALHKAGVVGSTCPFF